MESPLSVFLYLLMREHLPVATVKWMIDQAKLAGDPKFDAPELEALATRFAADLDELKVRPSSNGNGNGTAPTPPAAPPPPPARDPDPAPPSEPSKLTGQPILDRVLAWVNEQGDRAIRPGEVDKALGIAKVTRSRAITQLASEGKIRAVGNRGGRRVHRLPVDGDGDQTSAGQAVPGRRRAPQPLRGPDSVRGHLVVRRRADNPDPWPLLSATRRRRSSW